MVAAAALVVALAFLTARIVRAQGVASTLPTAGREPATAELKVSVFFGTRKALSVEELRTNALATLKAKGHLVPETNYCVINVKVQGNDPGCAVLFWDLEGKMTWQVLFNARGEVGHVSGGVVGHGTPAPGERRPKMPTGGVRVKP